MEIFFFTCQAKQNNFVNKNELVNISLIYKWSNEQLEQMKTDA